MSDSFADLWASSAPTKSTQQQPQQKLGSATQPRRPQYDAFSILSASQPPSRPVVINQRNDQQSKRPQVTSRGEDAFSGLFSSTLDGTGRNPDRANMTMAERAALTKQTNAGQKSDASQVPAPSALWDGLDTLARPTTVSPRPAVTAKDDFDFGFGGVPTAKGVSSTISPKNTAIENDDWGIHDLSSPAPSESRPAPTKTAPTTATLWDLDGFRSSEPQTSHPRSQPPPRSLTGTPGDFDFGNREDALLGEDSDTEDTFGIRASRTEHPEDDILGDLSKPVSHSHSPSPNPSTSIGAPVRPPRTDASPPPHIVGQLVEMGFSPIDARAALLNTISENGFDTQAATELLLSQAGENGTTPSYSDPHERERPRDRDRNGDRDQATPRRPPARVNPRSQSTPQTHPKPQSQTQLDVTAEKLLSQASEIGRGMFSKANALWKEGKERAVKMYEERAAVGGATGAATVSDGRPRWMRDREQMSDEWQRSEQTNAVRAEFKDEDEDQGRGQRQRDQRPPSSRPPQPQPPREREVDLFSTDSPTTAYQSPFRRGKLKETVPRPSSQSSSSPPVLSPRPTISTPSDSSTSLQPPRPARMFTTTIALSALSTSSSHKSTGTDAYKRGDFPAALAAYIRALSALPPQHILRVPILTNVALVRSKSGELRDTVKACEEAVVIVRRFVSGACEDDGASEDVGMSFSGTVPDFDEKTPVQVRSGKVSVLTKDGVSQPNGDLPTSVDLVEGLSKAFRRRAEALEGLEKWDAARSTWETLVGAEWAGAGVKRDAIKGVGRCRKMVDGGAGPSGIPASKPSSTRPTPQISVSSQPSAALTALRSTQDAQETEDAARFVCKDTVETRLNAWKSGKEGNIRALLTSLDDTILWPELGWRKVGMAEVVSKGQVKGAYVRAIARVHPDKLNAGNTTVEQRMVANGVFGTLNEAWNAFQQQ